MIRGVMTEKITEVMSYVASRQIVWYRVASRRIVFVAHVGLLSRVASHRIVPCRVAYS